MVFNSLEFLIFYPAVLILYFLVPTKFRWILLLAASYYFYLSWNVELVFLIVFTTVISYCAALAIEKSPKKSLRKLCLAATLVCSLGVLLFYKYFDFLAGSVISAATLFGAKLEPFSLGLILPVGISFYTFQTLSYAIDVYRGTEKVEKDFALYCLFVTFFPQLVAGPIERPGNLIPQLREKNKLTAENARAGLWKMGVGFFKKIVVADLVAGYVNSVFNSPESATGFGVVIASMLFAVQIYCDFSGYTDIAIGCSRVMGIRLMKNFDRPYTSQTIKEFWNRWHISLSTWLRDYLYFPLGGSRCSKSRHMFNIFIVFLASGIWHGANWTFVLWGILHGIYRIVGELTYPLREKLWAKLGVDTKSAPIVILRRLNTFALVCFSWVFFRANSLSDLGVLLSKLFTSWGSLPETISAMGLGAAAIIVTVLSIIVLDEFDILTSREDSALSVCTRGRISTVWCVWAVAVAWIMLLSVGGASSFIYFQF